MTTYVRSNSSTGSSLTLDIGSAGTSRLVVITVGWEGIPSPQDTAQGTVTVDGKNASAIIARTNPDGAGNHNEIHAIDEDALGTSNGSVTISFSGGDATWAIRAALYTEVASSTAYATAYDDTTIGASPTASLDVIAGGLVVASAGNGSTGGTASWTSPLTERIDGATNPPTSAVFGYADGIESSAQTSKSYIVTVGDGTLRSTLLLASFVPTIEASTSFSFSATGTIENEDLFVSDSVSFSISAELNVWRPSTVGTNGSAPSTLWFDVDTQNNATAQIQGNRIRFALDGTTHGGARFVIRDGEGNPLSLEDYSLEFKISYVTESTANSSATLGVNLRQQNIDQWWGTDWNQYPINLNGYSKWGWHWGSGDNEQNSWERWVNGSVTKEIHPDYTENPQPSQGDVLLYVLEASGAALRNSRSNITGSSAEYDYTGYDDYWTSGYTSIGFAANKADTIDIYDIVIRDRSVSNLHAVDISTFSTKATLYQITGINRAQIRDPLRVRLPDLFYRNINYDNNGWGHYNNGWSNVGDFSLGDKIQGPYPGIDAWEWIKPSGTNSCFTQKSIGDSLWPELLGAPEGNFGASFFIKEGEGREDFFFIFRDDLTSKGTGATYNFRTNQLSAVGSYPLNTVEAKRLSNGWVWIVADMTWIKDLESAFGSMLFRMWANGSWTGPATVYVSELTILPTESFALGDLQPLPKPRFTFPNRLVSNLAPTLLQGTTASVSCTFSSYARLYANVFPGGDDGDYEENGASTTIPGFGTNGCYQIESGTVLQVSENLSGVIDPRGTSLADHYNCANTTNSTRRASTTPTGLETNTPYYNSIFAKWDGGALNHIIVGGNPNGTLIGRYFNLETGEDTGVDYIGTPLESGIEAYGDGWYRCWTKTEGSSDSSYGYFIAITDSSDSSSAVGVVGEGAYFWGAWASEDQYIDFNQLHGQITVSDSWAFSTTNAELNVWRPPTVAVNGSSLDSNWFVSQTRAGDETIDIQNNQIRLLTTTSDPSGFRIGIRNGKGEYLSLQHYRFTVKATGQSTSQTTTISLNGRVQDDTSWRGASPYNWNTYPQTGDGYSSWGWKYGTGEQYLSQFVGGDFNVTTSVTGTDPADDVEQTLILESSGTQHNFKRYAAESLERDISIVGDAYNNSGYLYIGFGKGNASADDIRVYDIKIEDITHEYNAETVSANVTCVFSTSLAELNVWRPDTTGANGSSPNSGWFLNQATVNSAAIDLENNEVRITTAVATDSVGRMVIGDGSGNPLQFQHVRFSAKLRAVNLGGSDVAMSLNVRHQDYTEWRNDVPNRTFSYPQVREGYGLWGGSLSTSRDRIMIQKGLGDGLGSEILDIVIDGSPQVAQGEVWNFVIEAVGNSLKGKRWEEGSPGEPETWELNVVDNDYNNLAYISLGAGSNSTDEIGFFDLKIEDLTHIYNAETVDANVTCAFSIVAALDNATQNKGLNSKSQARQIISSNPDLLNPARQDMRTWNGENVTKTIAHDVPPPFSGAIVYRYLAVGTTYQNINEDSTTISRGRQITASIYLKRDNVDNASNHNLIIRNNTKGTNVVSLRINLATGAVLAAGGQGTGTRVHLEKWPAGWWRVALTVDEQITSFFDPGNTYRWYIGAGNLVDGHAYFVSSPKIEWSEFPTPHQNNHTGARPLASYIYEEPSGVQEWEPIEIYPSRSIPFDSSRWLLASEVGLISATDSFVFSESATVDNAATDITATDSFAFSTSANLRTGLMPTVTTIAPYGLVSGPTSSVVVDLPDVIGQGDLLLLFVGTYNRRTHSAQDSTSDDWTSIRYYDDTAFLASEIFAKIAQGDESGGTVTVTLTGGGSWPVVDLIRVSHFYGTLDDIQVSTEVSGGSSSTSANPASITTNWPTAPTLFIASVWGDDDGYGSVTQYPAGYENTTADVSNTTENQTTWWLAATKEAVTRTEDPSAFNWTTTDAYHTYTVAIRGQHNFSELTATDTTTFSTSAELNVWRYPTLGTGAATPNANWFSIETANGGTADLESNKLRLETTTTTNSRIRMVLLDGNGNVLNLENCLVTVTIDAITLTAGNSSAFTLNARVQNTTQWAGTTWSTQATPQDGYSSIGWTHGTGLYDLNKRVSDSPTNLSTASPGDPVQGETYKRTIQVLGDNIVSTWDEVSPTPGNIVTHDVTDSDISTAGGITLGFASNSGAVYVVDVYDIVVTELFIPAGELSATDSFAFASAGELNVWRIPTIGVDSNSLNTDWFDVDTQNGGTLTYQGNKARITTTSTAQSAVRTVIRNGSGTALSLKHARITFKADFVSGNGTANSSVVQNIRQPNIDSWRGSNWNSYPQGADGYASWGWGYLDGWMSLDINNGGNPIEAATISHSTLTTGNIYTRVIEAIGNEIKISLEGPSVDVNLSTINAQYDSAGALSFGFGSEAVAHTIDIYDIVVEDLTHIYNGDLISASDSWAFSTSASGDRIREALVSDTFIFSESATIDNATEASDITATDSFVFSTSAVATGIGTVESTDSFIFTESGAATGIGTVEAIDSFVFTYFATRTATIEAEATESFVFSEDAQIEAGGTLFVVDSFAFLANANNTATANLTVTEPFVFTTSFLLVGDAEALATDICQFSTSALLSGDAEALASDSFTFSEIALLTATGTLASIDSFAFTANATAYGVGAVAIIDYTVFSTEATTISTADLTAADTVVFSIIANAVLEGTLVVLDVIAFTLDATLFADINIDATDASVFSTQANLVGNAAAQGAVQSQFSINALGDKVADITSTDISTFTTLVTIVSTIEANASALIEFSTIVTAVGDSALAATATSQFILSSEIIGIGDLNSSLASVFSLSVPTLLAIGDLLVTDLVIFSGTVLPSTDFDLNATDLIQFSHIDELSKLKAPTNYRERTIGVNSLSTDSTSVEITIVETVQIKRLVL